MRQTGQNIMQTEEQIYEAMDKDNKATAMMIDVLYAHTYNRPVKPVSWTIGFECMEVMFWLYFSTVVGTIVSTLVYNFLMSGRLF